MRMPGRKKVRSTVSSPRLSVPSINLPKFDGVIHGISEKKYKKGCVSGTADKAANLVR
jgi:hypothetical protein